jgi:hypothetical protein
MAPMKPDILIDPVVRWAVHPGDAGRIAYIDGVSDPKDTLPQVDQLITRPFLVDPVSQQPVAVRVAAIHRLWDGQRHTLAVVVTLAH